MIARRTALLSVEMMRLIQKVFVLALCFLSLGSMAEPGVTSQSIVIGMSTPLTGPNARYGNDLKLGLELGFEQVNGSGGLHSRKIELWVQDDGGKPERALANTRAMLSSGVLALTGYHGARAIEAVLPLVDESGVPMVGAASSAEVLREPARRGLFNLRAGASEETAAMVYQLDSLGVTRIATIAQEDGLGLAGLEGMNTELLRLAMRPTGVVRIAPEAAAPAVAQAVETVCKTQPQALLLALDARSALAVIRQARKLGCTPQFYVMSEAGADLLAEGVKPSELTGVVVSQVLPHPGNTSQPLVAEYQRQMARRPGASPSYAGLEGFLYARVLSEALRRCGREPTRKCLVEILESRRLEVDGWRLQFAPGERRGSRFVEMTIISADGKLRR